jgi:hypothetical protein
VNALEIVTQGLGGLALNADLVNTNSYFPSLIRINTHEGADTLFTISPSRLLKLSKFVTKRPVSLLRSPPRSGKTALSYVLEAYFRAQGHEVKRISLLGFNPPRTLTKKEFKRKLNIFLQDRQRQAGFSGLLTWKELLRHNAYIIIDETQKLYYEDTDNDKWADGFWDPLKSLQGNEAGVRTRVLLMGAYGEPRGKVSTPMEFPPKDAKGLPHLRLTREEFDELVKKYCRLYSLSIPSPLVLKTLFNATAGHPGLVRKSLDVLLRDPLSAYPTEIEQLRFLWGSSYRETLYDTRALRWMKDWNPRVEEMAFIRHALNRCDKSSRFSISSELTEDSLWNSSVPSSFLKLGLIVEIGGGLYEFALPLLRIGLATRFIEARLERSASLSFEEFLKRTIERMSSETFRNTFSLGTDATVLERQWQNEFYSAAKSVVPEGATVSPDVGQVFGSEGEIDYYVNGEICWGVELLREGQLMGSHVARFNSKDGIYAPMLPHLKEWVVLDFRTNARRVYKKKTKNADKVWHVCYNKDYSRVVIKRVGKEDEELKVRGDDPSTPTKFDRSPAQLTTLNQHTSIDTPTRPSLSNSNLPSLNRLRIGDN